MTLTPKCGDSQNTGLLPTIKPLMDSLEHQIIENDIAAHQRGVKLASNPVQRETYINHG
ncbi:MAG: hypothetical protein KDD50_07065 [Bdellovibrionales bacterium]|nr:hypothetical protein [Bdellovibrionales bacterium]